MGKEVVDHSNDHFNGDRPACEEEANFNYIPGLCKLCKRRYGCQIVFERDNDELCDLYKPENRQKKSIKYLWSAIQESRISCFWGNHSWSDGPKGIVQRVCFKCGKFDM